MNISKILIIEDEILIAKDISNILHQEGYQTLIGVTSVDEAMVVLANNDFSLVLIDVNLRNQTDGVEIGNYLLELDTIPFIYITSHSDDLILERIKDSRPHGIIIKPFKPVDIKTTVSIVMNNFKYKKIDVTRYEAMVMDDVPFVLKNVIKYIDNNIENRIDIVELSNTTKWSSQHFIRVFTKYIGDTPYQYILKKKMEKAKALIIDTQLPMKDIAFDIGFLSYGNFCKLFKRELGVNPEVYRKSHKINKYLNKK
jgi:AraC-like DNA-binding protein